MGQFLQNWGTNWTTSSSDWGIQLLLWGMYKCPPWTGANTWLNTASIKPNQTLSSDLFMKLCCSRGAFKGTSIIFVSCVSGWHYLWSWAQLLARCCTLNPRDAVPDAFPWTMWTCLKLCHFLGGPKRSVATTCTNTTKGKIPSIKNVKLSLCGPVTAFFKVYKSDILAKAARTFRFLLSKINQRTYYGLSNVIFSIKIFVNIGSYMIHSGLEYHK